jgi:DNA-binding transcriptional ArsR family regulator
MASRSAGTGSSSQKKDGKAGGTKKPRQRAKRVEPKLKEMLDSRLFKALAHPIRVHILAAANIEPISPSGFARLSDESLGKIAHHFKALVAVDALELVKTRPVRGSTEHFYKATKRAIFTKAQWQTLPASIQGGVAGAALQDFVAVMVHALDSGTFNNRDDVVFTWDEVTLDELAWTKLIRMLALLWKQIPSLEEEAAVRLKKSDEEGFRVVLNLSGFEAPKTA